MVVVVAPVFLVMGRMGRLGIFLFKAGVRAATGRAASPGDNRLSVLTRAVSVAVPGPASSAEEGAAGTPAVEEGAAISITATAAAPAAEAHSSSARLTVIPRLIVH